ncbi:hypothetical protein BDZ91DRAFT_766508 [Kalaharituber pfeilii]|nr:hypothetical protein BDZ91DRAFT_766508 [Kalaharituber pfeilii]
MEASFPMEIDCSKIKVKSSTLHSSADAIDRSMTSGGSHTSLIRRTCMQQTSQALAATPTANTPVATTTSTKTPTPTPTPTPDLQRQRCTPDLTPGPRPKTDKPSAPPPHTGATTQTYGVVVHAIALRKDLGKVQKWLESGNSRLGKTVGIRWLRRKTAAGRRQKDQLGRGVSGRILLQQINRSANNARQILNWPNRYPNPGLENANMCSLKTFPTSAIIWFFGPSTGNEQELICWELGEAS